MASLYVCQNQAFDGYTDIYAVRTSSEALPSSSGTLFSFSFLCTTVEADIDFSSDVPTA